MEECSKDQRPLWHYTVGHRLLGIIEDGEIELATTNVPKWEKPFVWCILKGEAQSKN